MASDEEIYKQRYEVWRHLDKTRWQLLQVLVAIGTATALVLRSTSGPVEWWFLSLVGASITLVSCALLKVNTGIINNQSVLKRFAETIGDDGIPDLKFRWTSSAHWIAVASLAAGLFLLTYSGYTFFGNTDA